jgi:hypothetical protein
MKLAPAYSRQSWLIRKVFPFVLLAVGFTFVLLTAEAIIPAPPCTHSITSGDATGQMGAPFPTYQIQVDSGNPQSYDATGLPPGLTVNSATGVISGTPTAAGTYPVTLSATFNPNCIVTKPVTFTINVPSFVGFRLPDFPANPTPVPTPATNNMRLMLQVGATQGGIAHSFNATLEVDTSDAHNGSGPWVPYNHFMGIAGNMNDANDPARTSWIANAPLPVRELPGSSPAPSPYPSPPVFSSSQLTQSPPSVYLKTDPRSTRFGIFQLDTNPTNDPSDIRTSRIMRSLWPSGNPSTLPNGYGGNIADPGGPVEHAPNRFAGSAYYPATFCINGPVDTRDTATTTYPDNDNLTRPADAIYPGGTTGTSTGSSTPYYDTGSANSRVYHPVMLNRPFRNVAELGYVFRDLPWKTLDFFTDKSADAGLLDIFTINDGIQILAGATDIVGMTVPTVTAGQINLNTAQAADLQSVLAGTIINEVASPPTQVSNTGTSATDAPVLAAKIVNATNPNISPASATPMRSKAELITRVDPVTGAKLVETILPPASNEKQAVKAQREVVARAVSSVSQSRVWNLLIDVVAQTGRFKPNAASLQNDFVVEGEQHYWVHVAIDRFTGQVIDKQIEVVNE